MANRLKIAIQKKGRLAEQSLKFLQSLGLDIDSSGRYLIGRCKDFPADILFLRDDDIPSFVARGNADLGFVGQNVIAESGAKVKEVKKLGFGQCRLAVAVPKNGKLRSLKNLRSVTIATEYPNLTKKFFKKMGITVKLAELSGSVEIAPEMGVADAIVDLVETGSTLEAHSLVSLDPPVLLSEAVLIANAKSVKSKILMELLERVDAVLAARTKKYVMLNCQTKNLQKIEKILPALDSPTVLPLAKKNEVAVHSVATEKEFWEILPKLKKAGAKDILLLNIEKLVP